MSDHVLSFAFVASLSLFGCGGGSTPAAQPTSGGTSPVSPSSPCDEIAKSCHGGASDVAQQCHQLGHAGDAAACADRREACLTACAP